MKLPKRPVESCESDIKTAPLPPGLLPVDPPRGGPHDAKVAACADSFIRGDFHEARRISRQLLRASDLDQAERSFASEILHRTNFDPVALAVGLTSFALFWLILYLTLWR